MNEFLRQNYLLVTHSIELISAVIGLIYLKKFIGTAVIYFIYFLCFIIISEYITTYTLYIENNGFFSFLKGTIIEKNTWWSTLYWKIGAILFYSFYFRRVLKTNTYVLILKYATYVFLVFSIIFIAFNWQDFFIKPFPIINVLGAVIIFLCATLYFLEVLQSERILTFYKSINFYISATILIWWLIITPLVFYDIYFSTDDWDFVFLKWQIYLFANIFMYLTFTFALIWCKPETNL
jgi:hypothetical protein